MSRWTKLRRASQLVVFSLSLERVDHIARLPLADEGVGAGGGRTIVPSM